ncbi:MAG: histidine kinase [Allosphingosinicella sp.]
MRRLFAAGTAALLLAAAGLLIWKGRADADDPIPPAPPAVAADYRPLAEGDAAEPPAASEQSQDRKRFARADRNRDGRITLDEQLQPRRKAFAKLDRDGSGALSFEEWTTAAAERFAKADKDRSGWLDSAEYVAARPKPKPKPKCGC